MSKMPAHQTKYIFQSFGNLLLMVKQSKPNDNSLLDKKYEVLIKNLEKQLDYYRKYILVLPFEE